MVPVQRRSGTPERSPSERRIAIAVKYVLAFLASALMFLFFLASIGAFLTAHYLDAAGLYVIAIACYLASDRLMGEVVRAESEMQAERGPAGL